MSNKTSALIGIVGLIALIFFAGWLIFHFGLFPNLIVFLQNVEWIDINDQSTNGLYWTIIFAWLLGAFNIGKQKAR